MTIEVQNGDYVSGLTGGFWKLLGGTPTGDDIEEWIYSYLSQHVDVSALLGARIFPGYLPPTADRESITYIRAGGNRVETLEGSTGLVQSRYQFVCWSRVRTTKTVDGTQIIGCKEIAESLRLALDSYSGSTDNLTIQGIFFIDDADVPVELSAEEGGLVIEGVRQDFYIWHTETAPSF